MTRDEIYDHLAQVYLGKKSNIEPAKKKKQFNAWRVINIVITVVIFASSFYAFSAFLTHRIEFLQNKVIYSLNNGPIRIKYNLAYPHPPVKAFSLAIPQIDATKYRHLQFSIRGMDEGYPGTVRIELKNQKNESASIFIKDVGLDWKKFNIHFDEFDQISDWTNLTEVTFVMESWNAEKKKGTVLIDDVAFSS